MLTNSVTDAFLQTVIMKHLYVKHDFMDGALIMDVSLLLVTEFRTNLENSCERFLVKVSFNTFESA